MAIALRICFDFLVAALFFVFAIAAGSDATGIFTETDRRLEGDLRAMVWVALALCLAGSALGLHRIWSFRASRLRWSKAELALGLSFPVWLGLAMLAART